MAELSEIPEIGATSLNLLDLAGIRDAEHLAQQYPDTLIAELNKANDMNSIVKQIPKRDTVEKWISSAIDLINLPAEEQMVAAPAVNYEGNEQVAEMLASAPYAIPLPGKMMMEKQLRVGDVPAGLLLNRYSGDLDVRIGNPEIEQTNIGPLQEPESTRQIATQPKQRNFNLSQIKVIAPKLSPTHAQQTQEEDRVGLIRTPREKTNMGKNPDSRRYVRGVLHNHPWSLRIGAICSLLLFINLPLAIVSAFLLLLSRENPVSFSWVSERMLAFPISLPIIGIAYLIWGFSGKCRICTQKIFVHKAARKHIKSHHVLGLGYVLPLCLHLLSFSWFRCSSCGTPVRLKK